MIRRPPRSTLFPSRRSSDLLVLHEGRGLKQRRSGLFWSLPVLHPPARATEEACSSLPRVRIGDLPNPIQGDRKSTRLNSSHQINSYAVFCLKKKNDNIHYHC